MLCETKRRQSTLCPIHSKVKKRLASFGILTTRWTIKNILEPVDDAIEFGQNAVESPLRRAASFVLRVLTAMKIDHASQNPFEIDFWRKAYLLVRL